MPTYFNKKKSASSLKCFREDIFASEPKTLILLLAFSSSVFLVFLRRRFLWAPDEIRIAGIGANMQLAGEWTVPVLNGTSFLEKPPLYFWSTAIAFKWLGLSPFAAKLPSAISAIAGVTGLYLLSRSAGFSRSASFYSAAVLALSIQYFITGRRCITDLMLTAFVIWSIFGGYNLLKEKDDSRALGWAALLALALAGGLLTKGLVAAAVLLAALLPWYLLQRGLKPETFFLRQNMFLMGALTLAGLVFSIWLYHLYQKAGMDALYEVLWKNNFGRFSGGHREHVEPFWYYIKKLPEQLMPWAVIMPFALFFHVRDILVRRRKRSILLVSWLLVPFLLLSISAAKRPIYLLPVHPAAAWAAGTFIHECLRQKISWFTERGLWLLFLLLALSGAGASGVFLYFAYNNGGIQNTAFVAALTALSIGILALVHMDRRRLEPSLSMVLASLLVLFISWDSFGADIKGRCNSLHPLFSYVSRIEAGQNLILYQPEEALKGAAVFYLKGTLPECYDAECLENFKASLKTREGQKGRVLIIGQKEHLKILKKVRILRSFKIKSRILSVGKYDLAGIPPVAPGQSNHVNRTS